MTRWATTTTRSRCRCAVVSAAGRQRRPPGFPFGGQMVGALDFEEDLGGVGLKLEREVLTVHSSRRHQAQTMLALHRRSPASIRGSASR